MNLVALQNIIKPKWNLKNVKMLFRFYLISFVLAFLFSLPLYAMWGSISLFGLEHTPYLLGSILALISLFIFISFPSSMRFSFGFFVGILWFFWLSFSFRFYGFTYLIPLGVVGVALIYGAIFWVGAFCDCFVGRLIFGLLLGFIAPFGFDWLSLYALLGYSYFGVSWFDLSLLLCGVYILSKIDFRSHFKYVYVIVGALVLAFGLDLQKPQDIKMPDIDLITTHIEQDKKWNPRYIDSHISEILAQIDDSIKNNKKIALLPETAFAFPLLDSHLHQILLDKSSDISIIIGSIRREDDKAYNSTFVYDKGNLKIIDKSILVPFGEYFPVPNFLSAPIKELFGGLGEFTQGDGAREFSIDNVSYTNAICYEATDSSTYERYPRYVVASSNNAWFMPSVEESIQKMLIKYYARKYDSIVFHSANLSKSYIVLPSNL